MQKYIQEQRIGQGQFGIVTKIRRQADNRELVWKEIQYGTMNKEQKNQLINEVNILKDLNHEYVVKYYEHIINKKDTKVYIVMEYCHGGDLGKIIADRKKNKQYLDEEVLWRLIFQLISALNYCHNKKILHRDLKPANIFMDTISNNVKMGDFGLSRQLGQHSQHAQTHVGTPFYMSPEQVKNNKYNDKSDIWSLGCIIYELAALKRPFVGSNVIELGQNIESGRFEPLPFRYSCHLQDLISKMLSVKPQNRPSASKILSIPILRTKQQEKEIKKRYEEIRRRDEHLKQKEEKYKSKIQILEQIKGLEKLEIAKVSSSSSDTNKSKGNGKTLTISLQTSCT